MSGRMTHSEQIRADLAAGQTALSRLSKTQAWRLPKQERAAKKVLEQARRMIGHPKLEPMIDPEQVTEAQKTLAAYVKVQSKIADPRKGRDSFWASLGINLAIVAVLFAVFVAYS
jgi:septal ring factor EnvC (AmiA/AmiB activator)